MRFETVSKEAAIAAVKGFKENFPRVNIQTEDRYVLVISSGDDFAQKAMIESYFELFINGFNTAIRFVKEQDNV